jgi:hypothetical protein
VRAVERGLGERGFRRERGKQEGEMGRRGGHESLGGRRLSELSEMGSEAPPWSETGDV